MVVVRAHFLDQLVRCRHNGLVKVIAGIGRCGKSYLLLDLFRQQLLEIGVAPEHIIALELARPENLRYRKSENLLEYIRSKVVDNQTHYVLINDVQYADEPIDVLNTLLHERSLDIYVTGSNLKCLTTNIPTQFRGRSETVHLFPLSFKEFRPAFESDDRTAWHQYLAYGGLPEVVLESDDEKRAQLLTNLYRENFLKSIVEQTTVTKPAVLESVLIAVASKVGALTHPAEIAASLNHKATFNTVRSYLKLLEDARLIRSVRRYDIKARKYVTTPMKYYFEDTGLLHSVLGRQALDESRLAENVVYNELRLRGFTVDVGCVIHRQLKDGKSLSHRLEIDFVAERGSRRYYIQCVARADASEICQAKAALLAVRDAFPKILIVEGHAKAHYDDDGVLHIGVFDFLIDAESLVL
ncbi:MAG: ATP-binding protein [Sutterellaceae bacterium]|nr:ATP-binding protein [Sutterellaceae bacterium]